MKVLLGSLATVLVLLLGGCGGSSSDIADDPAEPTATASATQTTTPTESTESTESTEAPSSQPTGAVDFQQIAIVSQTAAGGEVNETAVRLDIQSVRETFLMQFNRPGFGAVIGDRIATASVPEGYVLIGAVVSIGCDVPPGVEVAAAGDGWTITPLKVEKPLQECLAPVTSVALVAVPA